LGQHLLAFLPVLRSQRGDCRIGSRSNGEDRLAGSALRAAGDVRSLPLLQALLRWRQGDGSSTGRNGCPRSRGDGRLTATGFIRGCSTGCAFGGGTAGFFCGSPESPIPCPGKPVGNYSREKNLQLREPDKHWRFAIDQGLGRESAGNSSISIQILRFTFFTRLLTHMIFAALTASTIWCYHVQAPSGRMGVESLVSGH